MKRNIGLSIIIPARNEEQIILNTLKQIEKQLKFPYQIIIVNDCSTDNTEAVVKDYAKNKENIRIVRTKPTVKGFSNASKKGFEVADKSFVVPVMADLCDEPSTINKMYKKIIEGYDIVCGSRYMKGGKKIGGPKLQGLFSRLVCLSLHFFTGIPTKDVSNAFKMYRKTVILNKVIFNHKAGVEASMEITFQVFFAGAKITEIPTTWKGRTKGLSKFKMFERFPRYFRIYNWALENTARKKLGFPLKKFYS